MIPTSVPVYDSSYKNEFSFEKPKQIVIFSDDDSNFYGFCKLENKEINRSVFVSMQDQKISNSTENNQPEEIRLGRIIDNYSELLSIFSKYNFANEASSIIRMSMRQIEKQLPFKEICEYLKSIVQNSSESVRVRCGIADYLCNYDYAEVQPSANGILEKLLQSENDIEIEYGLELADNFDDPAILPILNKCIPKSRKTEWTLKSIKEQLKGA